jgi:dienelactone hydrolase
MSIVCEDCAQGYLDSGLPQGTEIKVKGVATYVSFSTKAEGSEGRIDGRAVVIFTDVFGYELVNVRLIADAFAASGLTCYVPDLCKGTAMKADVWDPIILPAPTGTGLCARVAGGLKFAVSLPSLISWMKKHGVKDTLPIIDSFLDGLKESQNVTSVGVVGYCWGGCFALLMGGSHTRDDIAAVATAHPSNAKIPGDFEALRKPALIHLAEKDFLISHAQAGEIINIAEKKVHVTAKIMKGTTHGYAVRGNEDDEQVAEARKETLKEQIDFFKAHLRA